MRYELPRAKPKPALKREKPAERKVFKKPSLEDEIKRVKAKYGGRVPAAVLDGLLGMWKKEEAKKPRVSWDLFELLCFSGHPGADELFDFLEGFYRDKGDRKALERLLKLSSPCVEKDKLSRLEEELYPLKFKGPFTAGVVLPFSGKALSVSDSIVAALIDSLGAKGWRLIFFHEPVADTAPLSNVTLVVGPLMAEHVKVFAECGKPMLVFSQKELPRRKNIFRLRISLEREVGFLCSWAFRNGMGRFAVVYPEREPASSMAHEFKDKVESLGGEVVASVSYKPGVSDFWSAIKKVFYPSFKTEPPEKLIGSEKSEIEEKIYGDEPLFRSPSLDVLFDTVYQPEPVKLESKSDPLGGIDAIFFPDAPTAFFLFYSQLYYHGVEGVAVLGTSLVDTPRSVGKADVPLNPVYTVGYYPFKKGEGFGLLYILSRNLFESLADGVGVLRNGVVLNGSSIKFRVEGGEVYPRLCILKVGRKSLECIFCEEPGGGCRTPEQVERKDNNGVQGPSSR